MLQTAQICAVHHPLLCSQLDEMHPCSRCSGKRSSFGKGNFKVPGSGFTALTRHTWYLCPELVPLALASTKLTPQVRAAIACSFVSCTRKENLPCGKPILPSLPTSHSALQKLTLASLISPESWTLLNLLEISELHGLPSLLPPGLAMKVIKS